MRIGIGLPNATLTIRGGDVLLDFARRAEAAGFASLATIGRVAYPSYEELVVLAAAAGVTSRIGLLTDILLGPTREPVLLAKQAATLDQVSGGRFVLGVGVGMREDDFTVSGQGYSDRGRRWDAALDLMHRAWRAEIVEGADKPITPRPVNGESVPMLFGGRSEEAVRRVVRWGIGYTQGGGTPEGLGQMKERVDAAWREAGRAGSAEYRALNYLALGEDARPEAERNILDYYGEQYGQMLLRGLVRDAKAAQERVKTFEAAGCDELIFFCEDPHAEQVDRLAEAVL